MQQFVERGEIQIGVQWEGEVWLQKDKGISVDPYVWTEKKPILTQTKTISRYSKPVQKKLALALMNRVLTPEFAIAVAKKWYQRPSHKKVVLPENLANKGVENTADALEGLWIPDWQWYLKHQDDVVETVNEIFTA
jgi:putative spermidine/putrescine transport system substrate-binding protein